MFQYHDSTILYNDAMILHCYNITLLQYCDDTILQCFNITVIQYNVMMLRHHSATILR
jgi:hypothetical protein